MRTIHVARAGFAFVLAALLAAVPALAAAADFGVFTRADVLLVVSPHPDDESLCCAGAIIRARAAGARVAIVWITSGDGFEVDAHLVEHKLFTHDKDLLELARLRMAEAAHAAQLLDVAAEERFFLGYPDGGLTQLLHENFDMPYRSPHTGAAAVPYAQAFAAGDAYTGRNLERDLRTIIARLKPTWILAPTPLDAHADHRASGEFAMRALAALPEPAQARYWIVHGGFDWPRPRGLHPQSALVAPQAARTLPWSALALSPAEQATKESAIRVYETQMLLTSSFMLAFVKRNEIYSSAPLMAALPTAQNTALAPADNKFLRILARLY
jgi:LmbE family N-acetylglucosaminyl deacetylase